MGIIYPSAEPDTTRGPGSIPGHAALAVDIHADEEQLAVRRSIMLVAKHRFARVGYDGTSLAEIARCADVPLAELMRHFDDKLILLQAVFDEGWTSINLRLEDIVITSLTAQNAALSMLAVMTRILERDEDLARLLLFEGRRPNPGSGEIKLSKGYRRFFDICTELISRGQKDGSFKNVYHPRVIASMLIGTVESLLRDRMIAEQDNGYTPYSGSQLIAAFDALITSLKPEQRQETSSVTTGRKAGAV